MNIRLEIRLKAIIISLATCLAALPAFSEQILYTGSRNYKLTERTDLSRYENGKYVGLTSREVRSFIEVGSDPLQYVGADSPYTKDFWYDGNFYVSEATRRATRFTTPKIQDAIPSVFHVSADGRMMMYQDQGFPSFRSFPVYPKTSFSKGEKWQAVGERAVDPKYKGVFTRLPIYVEYTYEGREDYKGREVFRLSANWATRYDQYHTDPKGGDPDLKAAIGSHKATVLVACDSGVTLLVRDYVDETFSYYDGSTVRLKGTISLFTEYPPVVERKTIIPALNRIATIRLPKEPAKDPQPQEPYDNQGGGQDGGSGGGNQENGQGPSPEEIASIINGGGNPGDEPKNGMVVEETPSGLRISVRNIRFKPDSAEVLGGESGRLDELAGALKLVPENQFLVEGHTASTGSPNAEMALSIERAHTIVRELSARGIDADRFICRGHGGTKPVAENKTESGKAQNRRVEITILE